MLRALRLGSAGVQLGRRPRSQIFASVQVGARGITRRDVLAQTAEPLPNQSRCLATKITNTGAAKAGAAKPKASAKSTSKAGDAAKKKPSKSKKDSPPASRALDYSRQTPREHVLLR